MTSNIHDLFNPHIPAGDGIATVIETENGRATVVNQKGVLCQVTGHMSGVDALRIGDRVLTTRIGDEFIITGRFRREDESPAPHLEIRDGHLLVEAEKSVRLRAGEHRIEVHADGRIELDGCRITGHAEGRICLIGTNIELN